MIVLDGGGTDVLGRRGTITLAKPATTSAPPPPFDPLSLSPALWIDPSDTATVTISGSSGAYIGPLGLVLPGTATNGASTPDSAAVSVTGDIDVRVLVTLPSWTSTAAGTPFVSKDDVNTQRSYSLGLGNAPGDTILFFSWWDAGNTLHQGVANAGHGIANGTTSWVRATLDVDNGAGGHTLSFYKSPDGVTWTQIGTSTNTGAFTTSVRDTTSPLYVGGRLIGGGPPAGTYARAQVYNGIGGTVVFDADFAATNDYAATFAESSSNAATVTLISSTGGALVSQINDKSGNGRNLAQGSVSNMPVLQYDTLSGRPILVFDGTNDALLTAADVAITNPFGAMVVVNPSALPANPYVFDSRSTPGDVLLGTLTSTRLRMWAGTANLTGGTVVSGTPQLWGGKYDGASSTVRLNGAQVGAGNIGTNTLELLILGTQSGGTNPFPGRIGELVIWPAPSSFAALEAYLKAKWGTP